MQMKALCLMSDSLIWLLANAGRQMANSHHSLLLIPCGDGRTYTRREGREVAAPLALAQLGRVLLDRIE